MKGFTHFLVGLAAASWLPAAVREAAGGSPWPMLAGGVFGLMPDVLDFKGARFFARHDLEIVPDPLSPDMQMVADGLACAIREARRTGRTIRARLQAVRVGVDAWRHYRITFSPEGSLAAELGPVCTTGGRPLEEAVPASGTATAGGQLVIGYEAVVEVNILDGPMLGFTPLPDGRVRVDFIPWHRAWSHSLVLAAGAGLVLGLAADPVTGAAAALGWASHVAADQLGFLGSALFHPFRTQRYPGLQLARSMEVLPNLALCWMGALVLLWNLARFGQPPVPLNGPLLLTAFGLLPLGVLAWWKKKSAA